MGKGQAAAGGTAKADVAAKPVKKSKDTVGTSTEPAKKSDKKVVIAAEDIGKPKKAQKSEIDDIFSTGKEKAKKLAEGKRKAEKAAEQDAAAVAGDAPASKRARVEGSKDDIFGQAAAKGRKRTEEGFPIYSEEELGLGKKGGDTDLCPFDCDCCFI